MDAVELRDFSIRVREFLEERWAEWFKEKGVQPPSPLSLGMCRFSSLFLCRALEHEFGGEWLVEGGTPADEYGDPVLEGGVQVADGSWHPHYWVSDSDWEFIVDVTADQFGLPAVQVIDSGAAHYRVNYSEGEVADHLRDVSWRVDRWLDRWRSLQPGMMPL